LCINETNIDVIYFVENNSELTVEKKKEGHYVSITSMKCAVHVMKSEKWASSNNKNKINVVMK
jgi:hypothetical protein